MNVVGSPDACGGDSEGAPPPPERQDGRDGGNGGSGGSGCCCPQPADGHEGGNGGGREGGEGDGGGNGGAPATGGDDPGRLREMLLESERRTGALEAQIRRTLADYRNLERRVDTDVDNRVRERVARFAADMVSLRDDFERAGRAVAAAGAGGGGGGGSGGGQEEGGATVAAGIETVLRNMDSALSRHGVTAIDALGEIFDPDKHEAVSAEEDADLDEGTITKELARGYALDKRIIRPSQVVISKRPAAEDR